MSNDEPQNYEIVDSLFTFEPPKWYEKIYYGCLRGWNNLTYWFRRQRETLKFGFPLCDSWEFRSSCAEWVLPRLKHFRENHYGLPMNLTEEEWDGILDKMIWSFGHCDDHILPIYPENYDRRWKKWTENGNLVFQNMDERPVDFSPVEKHNEKLKEGFVLFGEYFMYLWD